MTGETVTISTHEYSELLCCKAELAERRLAAAATPAPFSPRGKLHMFMSAAQEAEILWLHSIGLCPDEIGVRVGQTATMVRHCIARHATTGAPA